MNTSCVKNWNVRVAAGVVVLVAATSALENTTLAAPNSWNNTPAWANQAPARRPSSGSSQKRDTLSSVVPAPFAPESNNVALDVGQVFLMGDLSDKYSDSLGMQLHYTYGVSDIFGFDSSFGYSNHSDGKYSMTTLLTGLRTNLTWYDKVIPYAVVGLGFYKPSVRIDELSTVSPIVFGLHLGPGVTLQLTNQIFFGAALTFHDMFGSNEVLPSGKLVSVGGTYTSFFLNAGMSF